MSPIEFVLKVRAKIVICPVDSIITEQGFLTFGLLGNGFVHSDYAASFTHG